MKIIDYIKNLFKHKEINTNGELVRPADLIKIPKRKEFNNDSLVDSYKDEYNSILSTMKDYDTLILEAEELNSNIIMTSKLLFNIAIKEEYKNEKSVEDRINYLINSEKLDLYKNDINNLQNEVIGRLIAISEIRKELFLSKKKKDAIDNIINRLCLSLNTLYSIEVSIINNIERYKNESKYNSEPSKEEKKKEYEIIDEKIKHLNWLQEILDSDSQINIRTDINYILKDIALIEKELEEYTYIHKGEITEESKNKEINNILEIPFDIEHKEELLKRIKEIEKKYRVFYEYREYQEYGELVIDESDLTNIYNLKFSALTISKDGIIEPFVNDETDKIEIEYYQNIIFSIIQDVIMGRNEYFNELFKGDIEEAISLLIEGLKYGNNEINYEEILENKYLLNLLLAIEKSELSNFYDNYKIRLKDYITDTFFEGVFILNNNIPIKTYFFFKDWLPLKLLVDKSTLIEKTDVLKNLYNDFYELYLTKIPKNENKYYIPEGIKKIKRTKFYNEQKIDELFHKIDINSNVKVVYLPSSLEEVNYQLFSDDCQTISVILNEGLKKITSKAFYNQEFCGVTIPSTIEYIDRFAFDYSNLKLITFNNISFSKFVELSDEMFMGNFVENKGITHSLLQYITFHYDGLDMNIDISISSFNKKDYHNNVFAGFYFIIFREIYIKLLSRFKNLKVMLQIFNISEEIEEMSYDDWDFNDDKIKNDVIAKVEMLLNKVGETEKKLDEFINNNYDKYRIEKEKLKLKLTLLTQKKFYYEIKEDLLKEINDLVLEFKKRAYIPKEFNEHDSSFDYNLYAIYNKKYFSKIEDMAIDDNDFYNLYNLKYNALMLTNNGFIDLFYDKIRDDKEKEYYEMMIHKKIVSAYRSLGLLEKEYNKISSFYNEIFKNNKEVLNNYFLLNLLNALSQYDFTYKTESGKHSLYNLFENITVQNGLKISDKEDLSGEGIFTYDKNYFTLGSALLFKKFNILKNDISYDYNDQVCNIPESLVEFYFIYLKYVLKSRNSIMFSIPEGITSIKDISKISDISLGTGSPLLDRDIELADYIKKNAKDQTVSMPKSLRKIEGLIDIPLNYICLNEGLISLEGNVFSTQDFTEVYIPSTIRYIDRDAFNTDKILSICIKEDALIEYGERYLNKILKNFKVIEDKEKKLVKLDLESIFIMVSDYNTYKYESIFYEYPHFDKKHYWAKDDCIHFIYEDIIKKINERRRVRSKK